MAGVALNTDVTCVFVLFSIHDVMKAERVLKERGIPFDTIPVPKEISSDCGMAIMTERSRQGVVTEILKGAELRIKGVYEKTTTGYRELTHG